MGDVDLSGCKYYDDCPIRKEMKGLCLREGHAKCTFYIKKKKGKCYSKVNQGQRVVNDAYNTPLSIVAQFLNVKSFDPSLKFLEPARAKGSVVKVLREHGYRKITSYDILDTPSGVKLGESKFNFFNEKRVFDYIITNPPYRQATEFIRKAAEVCRYEFAFFMPLAYLHGKARHDNIYKNRTFPFKLKTVWILTRMPMLTVDLPEDGKYKTGMQVYAWYLFEKGYDGEAVFDWIDNNEYVIGGKKSGNKK